MSGRTRALVVAVLTVLVVATTSTIQMFQLSRVVVQESLDKTDLIARQIYAQMRGVLAQAGRRTAPDALRTDRDLRNLIDASLGHATVSRRRRPFRRRSACP